MKNKLLWFLLTLLGFGTSCSDDDGGGNYPVAYGTPSATFSVKGKVTDEEGKPIPGIEVQLNRGYEKQLTDKQGNFKFAGSEISYIDEKPMPLRFTDINGPENGSFAPSTVRVQFTQNPDVEPDSWYQGDFTAPDVTATMKRTQGDTNE